MEEVRKFSNHKFSNSQIVIGVVTLVVFILLALYLLLYSSQIANEKWVMDLRYKYVLAIDNVDFLKPTIRASRWDDDRQMYVYGVQGRVEKVEVNGITLRGLDGQQYFFILNWKIPAEGYVQHHGYTTSSVNMRDKTQTWLTFNKDDLSKSGDLDHSAYDPKQIYSVIWADSRKLSQIVADHKVNPNEPMFTTNEQYVNMVRYE